MKEYFQLWTIKRFIQLLVGLYFIWEYFQDPSILALIFGGMMLFQSILNVGCFSSKGCSTPKGKKVEYNENEDVEFEEIK